jgi:hypothetical protein
MIAKKCVGLEYLEIVVEFLSLSAVDILKEKLPGLKGHEKISKKPNYKFIKIWSIIT